MNDRNPDTTAKKIDASHSPKGDMGQSYLASGRRMSMRLWDEIPRGNEAKRRRRDYETIGFAISGRAELDVEGQTLILEAGDSWVVPEGAEHAYRVLESFTAVESTCPPAEVHGRDDDTAD